MADPFASDPNPKTDPVGLFGTAPSGPSTTLTPGIVRKLETGARARIDHRIASSQPGPPGSAAPLTDIVGNVVSTGVDSAKSFWDILADNWTWGPAEDSSLSTIDPIGNASALWTAREPEVVTVRTDSEGRSGFGGRDTPTAAPQRVDMTGTQNTGNPTADNLRLKMRQSESDAQEYADLIATYNEQVDQLNREQLAAIQAGAMEVAAQYDEKIDELKGRIADAKRGLASAMNAYKAYRAAMGPQYDIAIAEAKAGEEAALALRGKGDETAANIMAGYDQSAEDLEATADLIGAGGHIAPTLRGTLDKYEDMIKSAARGKIQDIDRIAAAAAKFATATAQATKDQDLWMSDIDRQKLEVNIQSQIDQMLDNVAQLEKDKAAAVQSALDQYDPMGGFESADEAWEWAFDQFVRNAGWSIEEESLIRQAMQGLISSGAATNRAEAIKALLGTAENPGAMRTERKLATQEWVREAMGGELHDYMIRLIDKALADPTSDAGKYAISQIGVAMRHTGTDFTSATLSEIFRESDANFDNLLDMVDMYEQHTKTWNEARAATAHQGYTGKQAAANYVNRNDPAYVRRRNVGVPEFVKSFLAAFGKSAGAGKEWVGGITSSYKGSLRSPKMTGNGRSSNSDHLSGGAVDLYGASVEELEAIERWARSQPGVSLVVYSGNPSHETGIAGGASAGNNGRGHVHVSLQVGYW